MFKYNQFIIIKDANLLINDNAKRENSFSWLIVLAGKRYLIRDKHKEKQK